MMNKIEEAIIYATVMHQGKVRKLGSIPYAPHFLLTFFLKTGGAWPKMESTG